MVNESKDKQNFVFLQFPGERLEQFKKLLNQIHETAVTDSTVTVACGVSDGWGSCGASTAEQ